MGLFNRKKKDESPLIVEKKPKQDVQAILKAYDRFTEDIKEKIQAKMKELKKNKDDDPVTLQYHAKKIIDQNFKGTRLWTRLIE